MPSSSLSRHAPSLSVVAALISIPLSCMPGMADTIIYTWIEDDGQAVAGQLVVNSSAQAAGQITASDIISFSWTGLHDTYNATPPLIPDPLPISTLDAGFAGSPPAHLGNVVGLG